MKQKINTVPSVGCTCIWSVISQTLDGSTHIYVVWLERGQNSFSVSCSVPLLGSNVVLPQWEYVAIIPALVIKDVFTIHP